jgi:hypothetical protein
VSAERFWKGGSGTSKWIEGQIFADVDGAFKARSQQRKVSRICIPRHPPTSLRSRRTVEGARDIPAIVKVEATDAQHRLVYPIFH